MTVTWYVVSLDPVGPCACTRIPGEKQTNKTEPFSRFQDSESLTIISLIYTFRDNDDDQTDRKRLDS